MEEAGSKLGLSRDQVEKMLLMMVKPASAAELRAQMGLVNATKFKKKCLDPLIEFDVIKMTRPKVPNSRLQQYVLTDIGRAFLDEIIEVKQAEGVSVERVNRLIAEFAEALPRFEINLPAMEKVYETSLPVTDVRLFQANYKMKKEGDGFGLAMMQDIKFYFPEDKDFHYVKLIVDRMERKVSELDKMMKH